MTARLQMVGWWFGMAAAGVLCGCSPRPRDKASDLELRLATVRKALQESQQALKAQEESARALEAKIQQLTEVLTNSTAQLRAAQERLSAYEALEQSPGLAPAAGGTAAVPGLAIPQPLILQTNQLGVLEKVMVFPSLYSKTGQLLGRDVQYSATYGRRVVFVFPDKQRKAFDVDVLHPQILSWLGIDAEKARVVQAQQDSKHQAFMTAWYQRAQSRRLEAQKLADERKAAAAEAAAQQAKVAEEQRRQDLQEFIQLKTLENDRMKAEAAVQQADAAIIEALNPRYPTYHYWQRYPGPVRW